MDDFCGRDWAEHRRELSDAIGAMLTRFAGRLRGAMKRAR